MLYINHLSKKEMDKKNNDGLLEDMPEKRKKDGAFVRVGTTLYKLADMPLVGGGFVRKRIVWNNETLRQDYGRAETQDREEPSTGNPHRAERNARGYGTNGKRKEARRVVR